MSSTPVRDRRAQSQAPAARAGRPNGHSGAAGGTAREPAPPGRRPDKPAAVVTGGAGFLGSHLCDRLIGEGYRVFCVDSFYTGLAQNLEHLAREPRFVLMEHDIRQALPAVNGVREIYNLACPASPPHYQRDPVHTVATNVLGNINLLDLAARQGARFLLASTSEVYGDPEVHPQPESYLGAVNSTGPRACYDEGKRVAEALCFDFRRTRKVDVRVSRIFNTYGPRMRPDDGRIVSNLITQSLRGEPMTIYGDGRQTRSLCYVSDLVEGLVRLMWTERSPATPVNLGNPEEHSILEIADLVTSLTCSNAPLVHKALPADDPRRRRPDIRLAMRLLDWRPQVRLQDGLRSTLRWFTQAVEGPLADSLEARCDRWEPSAASGVASTKVGAPCP